jgi:hypothetical protein
VIICLSHSLTFFLPDMVLRILGTFIQEVSSKLTVDPFSGIMVLASLTVVIAISKIVSAAAFTKV